MGVVCGVVGVCVCGEEPYGVFFLFLSLFHSLPLSLCVCVCVCVCEEPYGSFFSFYLSSSLPPLSLCGMLTFRDVPDGVEWGLLFPISQGNVLDHVCCVCVCVVMG